MKQLGHQLHSLFETLHSGDRPGRGSAAKRQEGWLFQSVRLCLRERLYA